MKDGRNLETEQVQTNTNHFFTFYQSASKPLTSPKLARMRAQSQQPPGQAMRRQPEQNDMFMHNILPVPIRKPPRPFQSGIVERPANQNSQVLPGVATNPVPLVSHDSIERARSRRKMRVLAAAVNTSR